MTRRPELTTVFAVAALAALAVALLVVRAAPAPAQSSFPARMQIVTTEFRLSLSRVKVPSGLVKIELVNYGEDPHDVKLRRLGTTRVFVIPQTAPGERTTRTFRLKAGRYVVWCDVAHHKSLGMKAALRSVRD